LQTRIRLLNKEKQEKIDMNLDRYKEIAFWPITFVSILFLFIFCATNFKFPIAENNESIFRWLNLAVWAIFVVDFILMLLLSTDKKIFIKHHWFHLIVVLVPFLRSLRIALLILMLMNVISKLKNRILISISVYASVTAALFVLLGAASVYNAEIANGSANIKTREDAFWWAIVTIFTVGYGDRYPVTSEGRLIGSGLMIAGIAIVGSITATFAGWIISQIKTNEID
jgi:voltage-gated potassium channel